MSFLTERVELHVSIRCLTIACVKTCTLPVGLSLRIKQHNDRKHKANG